MLEHEIEPQLDDRRRRIPVERELQNQHLVLYQALLLAVDIDVVPRVTCVQIDHGDTVDPGRCVGHLGIDPRSCRIRVGMQNKHASYLRHSLQRG